MPATCACTDEMRTIAAPNAPGPRGAPGPAEAPVALVPAVSPRLDRTVVATARAHRAGATRLTSSVSRQRVSSSSSTDHQDCNAADTTSPVRGPRAVADDMAARMTAGFVTSPATQVDRLSLQRSRGASSRSTPTTLTPSADRRSTTARPMPRAAPVTMTDLLTGPACLAERVQAKAPGMGDSDLGDTTLVVLQHVRVHGHTEAGGVSGPRPARGLQ